MSGHAVWTLVSATCLLPLAVPPLGRGMLRLVKEREIMCIYFIVLCIVLLTADRRFAPEATLVGPRSNQAVS